MAKVNAKLVMEFLSKNMEIFHDISRIVSLTM